MKSRKREPASLLTEMFDDPDLEDRYPLYVLLEDGMATIMMSAGPPIDMPESHYRAMELDIPTDSEFFGIRNHIRWLT